MNIAKKLLFAAASVGATFDDLSEIKMVEHAAPLTNSSKTITMNLQRTKSYKDILKDELFKKHLSV